MTTDIPALLTAALATARREQGFRYQRHWGTSGSATDTTPAILADAILATAPGKELLDLARQGQHVPALVFDLRMYHDDIGDGHCICGHDPCRVPAHLAAAKEASE